MTPVRKKEKTSFGLEQLTHPSPKWANVVFGIIIVLTTAVMVWVVSTTFISDKAKVEWVLLLKCIDIVVFGVAKLFGVEPRRAA